MDIVHNNSPCVEVFRIQLLRISNVSLSCVPFITPFEGNEIQIFLQKKFEIKFYNI